MRWPGRDEMRETPAGPRLAGVRRGGGGVVVAISGDHRSSFLGERPNVLTQTILNVASLRLMQRKANGPLRFSGKCNRKGAGQLSLAFPLHLPEKRNDPFAFGCI